MSDSPAEATVPRYEYAALPSSTSIRLLEVVCQRSATAEFECHFHVVDLQQHSRSPYLALSYTWKLDDIAAEPVERPACPIVMIGGYGLPIGHSLFDFLEQFCRRKGKLAQKSKSKLLWIDAVCINQQDFVERASQVAFMRKIYESATEVVVWLGRHDSYSRAVIPLIDLLTKINFNRTTTNFDGLHYQSRTDSDFYEQNQMKPLSETDHLNMCSFYSRSWFHRLWTMQELVVAKAVIVLCGETNSGWLGLQIPSLIAIKRGWTGTLISYDSDGASPASPTYGCDAICYIDVTCRAQRLEAIGEILAHYFGAEGEDALQCAKLAMVIHIGRRRQVTDQRDRIFAPYGLTLISTELEHQILL